MGEATEVVVGTGPLSRPDVVAVARDGARVRVSDESWAAIARVDSWPGRSRVTKGPVVAIKGVFRNKPKRTP